MFQGQTTRESIKQVPGSARCRGARWRAGRGRSSQTGPAWPHGKDGEEPATRVLGRGRARGCARSPEARRPEPRVCRPWPCPPLRGFTGAALGGGLAAKGERILSPCGPCGHTRSHVAGFLGPPGGEPLAVTCTPRSGSLPVEWAAADRLITIHGERKGPAHTSIFGARTSSGPQ